MKLYADLPQRRTTQIVADLAMLGFVVGCALVGRAVHDAVAGLAGSGRTLESTGTGFAQAMTDAAGAAGSIPIVGDNLAGPLQSAASAGSGLSLVGSGIVSGVESTATVLGWSTALLPIAVIGLVWLLLRLRFVRRATATSALLGAQGDVDLLALRAIARQPLRRLAAVSADPVGAWRAGDPMVISALARPELRDAGLRPGVRAQG